MQKILDLSHHYSNLSGQESGMTCCSHLLAIESKAKCGPGLQCWLWNGNCVVVQYSCLVRSQM